MNMYGYIQGWYFFKTRYNKVTKRKLTNFFQSI